MALRLLHIADTHIGAGWPRRKPARDARAYRGDDFARAYQRVLERAREHNVDLVIHAGDLFDHSRPTQAHVAEACEPLLRLAQEGVPVVVVPGNHERSALPACLWLAHENVHIMAQPRTVQLSCRGVRVAVSGFPCVRRGVAAQFDGALRATGWSEIRADVHILAVHQTFRGARCGPADYVFRGGDDVIDTEAVPGEFHYVAAGHVHRHQVLRGGLLGGPPIVYAGSPDRISFAEMDEPKGCVLVTFAAGRADPRFIEHDVRPMCNVPIDVGGHTAGTLPLAVHERLAAAPPGAIVALRLTGQATRHALRNVRLAGSIARQRPDLMVHASWNGVEWVPEREADDLRRSAGLADSPGGVFSVLDAPPAIAVAVTRERVADLPASCGTYALLADGGRLLYVGKALNVRARVRAHLRRRPGTAGWTAEVARMQMRPAADELEALLVEAELVRRLRPPFNQQMRHWRRYCYVVESGRAFGQLDICDDAGGGAACYGPFRSRWQARDVIETVASWIGTALCPQDAPAPRLAGGAQLCERYFAGVCAGPCAERLSPVEYERRLALRRAVLAGAVSLEAAALDPAPLVAGSLVAESLGAASLPAEWRAAPVQWPLPPDEDQRVAVEALIQRCERLRQARQLMNGLLVLGEDPHARAVVVISAAGLALESLGRDIAETARIRAWAIDRARRHPPPAVVPRGVADSLTTAAAHIGRAGRGFITAAELQATPAAELHRRLWAPTAESASASEREPPTSASSSE